MGIRVQHNYGGAIAMGAYVAGRQGATKRRSKYFTEAFRRQAELRNAAALRGRRYGTRAIEPPSGTWSDPMAGLVQDGDTRGARQIRAQRKANLRAGRRGRPTPYPGAEPTFIPDPTEDDLRRMDREKDREERERRHQDMLSQRNRSARAALLPEVPDELTDPTRRKDLQNRYNDIIKGLTAGTVDFNDPDAAEKFEDDIESYIDDVTIVKIPTPAERARKSAVWYDPATGDFSDDPIPGGVAGYADEGGRFTPYDNPIEDKRAEEAEESEKAARKREDEILKEKEKLRNAKDETKQPLYDLSEDELLDMAIRNVNQKEMDRQKIRDLGKSETAGAVSAGLGDLSQEKPPLSPAPTGGAEVATPQAAPPAEQFGAEPPAGLPPQDNSVARRRQDDTVRRAAAAKIPAGLGVDEGVAAWMLADMPVVRSDKEFEALQPGTHFLTPEGEVKKR